MALSARLLGMPSVLVMPQDSPAAKLAATRQYQQGQAGSEVVLLAEISRLFCQAVSRLSPLIAPPLRVDAAAIAEYAPLSMM